MFKITMNKDLTVSRHEVAKDIQHWYLKLIQISFFNWSEAEGSVSQIKDVNLALYMHLHNRSLNCLIFTQQAWAIEK